MRIAAQNPGHNDGNCYIGKKCSIYIGILYIRHMAMYYVLINLYIYVLRLNIATEQYAYAHTHYVCVCDKQCITYKMAPKLQPKMMPKTQANRYITVEI